MEGTPPRQFPAWGPVVSTWIVFLGWSLARIPIPGVNEPHYLGKARHWWDHNWCSGDFFLDSSNPHLVFYATFGLLTQGWSLEIAAGVGRAIGLLILAIGWQRLAQVLVGNRWAGLIAAPLFLLLQALGNFSGEWLVGGIEAKVPAYGLLFWGVSCFLQRQFKSAGILLGLSVSFHPLVGIWGIVAGGIATVLCAWLNQRSNIAELSSDRAPISSITPDLRSCLWMGVLLLVAALPGLIPAFDALKTESADVERIANQLQVGSRLAHHLDPMRFSKTSYRYWGLLFVVWQLLAWRLPGTSQRRWWQMFVGATITIALIGVAIGWGPRPLPTMPGYEWRMKLLKFYFFRLGDQMVPVAVSMAAVSVWLTARQEVVIQNAECRISRVRFNLVSFCALSAMVVGALLIRFPDDNPSRLTATQYRDWVAATQWLKKETDEEDLVLSTDAGLSLKWFAQRPEYVNFKDMPQDAVSILEWNRRLWVIANWRVAAMQDQHVSRKELGALFQKTKIRYLVCQKFGPIDVKPVYSNNTVRIYDAQTWSDFHMDF